MIVRCGRCQVQFDVPGVGRFQCPACGTTNEIRGGPDTLERPPAPEPVADAPSPRVECDFCGFSFIVGDVATAPCPMCGEAVVVEGGEA
jgi:Zn finger protein HypA/HybF involved in hydrogenase expression